MTYLYLDAPVLSEAILKNIRVHQATSRELPLTFDLVIYRFISGLQARAFTASFGNGKENLFELFNNAKLSLSLSLNCRTDLNKFLKYRDIYKTDFFKVEHINMDNF